MAVRPVLVALSRGSLFIQVFIVFLLLTGSASAQFTGNIQGTVEDPSGAAIPQAKVALLNLATQASAVTTTDATGGFRFLSLAPGPYKITVEATGFARAEATVSLDTNQNLNVPISVKVGTEAETVTVTAEALLVNTTETRNQMTLETEALSSLPLAGRSMFSLVTVAPGVSGKGTTGGGSPGSGVDNFSTETEVDASANGQGRIANMWIVDGLDVTSAIRQGVLNLTPNPDVIQEASNQINTFAVEYGHSSSIQFAMTTKSGQDRFHGMVSDYYNKESMYAKYSLPGSDHPYNPFHSNNISATIGGPIIPGKQFFFFFGGRTAAFVGFHGQPGSDISRPSVCRVGQSEPSEHLWNQDPERVHALQRDRQRRHEDGTGHLPGHVRNPGDRQPALRHRDDRQRGVQLEQLPEWHAVLWPHRQGLQEGSDLRQLLPNHPRLRRTRRHSPVLDHESHHAECLPGELDTHLQCHDVQRAHLRPESRRGHSWRDG